MGVDSREGLAIADLIFYIPALFVAFYISFKHGFGKKKGWFFLIMLSLVRLVGAIAELIYVNSPSTGALTAYIVCSSVGLSPLILILLAILLRVQEGMANGPIIQPRFFYLLALLPLIGLIIAIVGATDEIGTNVTPDEVSHGQTMVRAAVIIFMVVFIILAVITGVSFASLRAVYPGDKVLLYAAALSVPFLFVRLLYAVLADFGSTNSQFSLITGSVIIQGCMATLEEFICVILYSVAGIMAPKLQNAAPATNVGNGYNAANQGAGQELPNQGYTGPNQGYADNSYNGNGNGDKPQYQSRRERRGGRRRGGPITMLINRFT